MYAITVCPRSLVNTYDIIKCIQDFLDIYDIILICGLEEHIAEEDRIELGAAARNI